MRTSARARDRQAGAPSGVAPVARDTAIPRDPRPVGILTLAALAVVYTLYLGREFLLPVTLALVLKLLLQPAVRLLTRHLRLPATAAALLVILAVFGTVGLVILAVSVPASGCRGRGGCSPAPGPGRPGVGAGGRPRVCRSCGRSSRSCASRSTRSRA